MGAISGRMDLKKQMYLQWGGGWQNDKHYLNWHN